MNHKSRLVRLLVALLSAGTCSLASAAMTLTLQSVTPSLAQPGYYEWIYELSVDSSDGLGSGAYFTLYDFGPVATIQPDSDWGDVDSQLVGITPSGLTPTDDTTIMNYTFNWTGGQQPGETFSFSLFSLISDETDGNLSWLDYDRYPLTGALIQEGLALTRIPAIGDSSSTVPEPATLALLGFGLIGLGFSRRRKH